MDETEHPSAAGSAEALASYLRPTVQGLGVRAVISSPPDVTSALSAVYELVQLLHAAREERSMLRDQLHHAHLDERATMQTAHRLCAKAEAKDTEGEALHAKLQHQGAWYRDEVARLEGERDELEQQEMLLEQRQVQMQHEVQRRKEEFEQLQAKLHALLGERQTAPSRTRSSNGGGAAQGARPRPAPPAAARRASQADRDTAHREVIDAYKARKLALGEENAALQRALLDLQRQHKDLLNSAVEGHTTAQQHDQTCAAVATGGGSGTDSRAAAAIGAQGSGRRHWQQAAPLQELGQQHELGQPPSPLQQQQPPPAGRLPRSPASAWQGMKYKLQQLAARRQHMCAPYEGQLAAMAKQADSAAERALLATLQEASGLMREQEQALRLALEAVGTKQQPASSPGS